ncbi:hypothetical protein PsYK624_011860 [Phanerochaete sordida]|uniref:Uncharacterized protein n=1 Tax=Phanerochaete sordida TaxID=48140 RepID=A0A9P3FZE6_9APHY|nr:hypothetical protein PsYK624_011860 [Phanerochaete sordida]
MSSAENQPESLFDSFRCSVARRRRIVEATQAAHATPRSLQSERSHPSQDSHLLLAQSADLRTGWEPKSARNLRRLYAKARESCATSTYECGEVHTASALASPPCTPAWPAGPPA